MTDRDLTPAEARAEVEAFMGEGFKCHAEWGYNGAFVIAYTVEADDVRVGSTDHPTYRAAVDALKAAWRDAVRPWVGEAMKDGSMLARVLKEDSK